MPSLWNAGEKVTVLNAKMQDAAKKVRLRMQNPKIKAVIFDLGGVLVGFKQESFVKETFSFVPSPGKLDWKQPEVIEAHRQFELGNLSKKRFYCRILPFMGEKISFKEFSR
ncbi:MAG: hypothetical protein Q8N60_01895, partial [Candidatus Diapherotrites archaeon]|nr:hypothetical protein [Candidatus Diapherotrites archaeon]